MTTVTAPIDQLHADAIAFREWLAVEVEQARRRLDIEAWTIGPAPDGFR